MDGITNIVLLLVNFLIDNVEVVATAVGAVVATVARVSSVLKEVNEVLVAFRDAGEPDPDGKVRITKEEWDRIEAEVGDVIGFLPLLKKLVKGKNK